MGNKTSKAKYNESVVLSSKKFNPNSNQISTIS